MSDGKQHTQRGQVEVFPLWTVATVILATIAGVAYNFGGVSMVVSMTFPLVILTFMILAVVRGLPGGEQVDE